MLIREPSPADRIVFLDNLRLVTVLAVVALPAGVAYAPIVPLISYVVALGQGGTESYLHYWLRILPTTFRLDFHVLTPESASTLHNYIWSFHLWFLALLLLFCGMLALWHAVAARGMPPVGPERRGPDRQWFTAHRIPGRLWLWGLLGIVTYAAMLVSGLANMAPGPKPVWIPLAHGLARTLVALSVTGFLVVFGQRFWNLPGGISASLSAGLCLLVWG